MKKILLAALVIAGVTACNSPQEMTASDTTSNSMTTAPVDSGSMPSTDTTMQGDTMKRDTLR